MATRKQTQEQVRRTWVGLYLADMMQAFVGLELMLDAATLRNEAARINAMGNVLIGLQPIKPCTNPNHNHTRKGGAQ